LATMDDKITIEEDMYNTAAIIDRAFPKSRMFGNVDYGLTITDLHSALFRARKYCQSNMLGDCVVWARRILHERKPTLKKAIVDKIDQALAKQEGSDGNC